MNEATLTRRSMMDLLKFLPRRPAGDPAAVTRRPSKWFFGSEMDSKLEMLGTDTSYPVEPAALAMALPSNSIQASDIRTGTTGTTFGLLAG